VDWLILSIVGAAALAVTGIIDKFILGRYVKDPLAYLVTLVVMQQILVLAIPVYLGWGYVFPQSIYAMVTGLFQVVLWTAYLFALQQEETSRVAALVYVFPVFVFLGAYLFFGETLDLNDYAGGAMLVGSAVLISYRPGLRGEIVLSPALKYMAVFWIFTAAYALESKYLLDFMTEWHLILWSSLGSLLAVLPLLVRQSIRTEVAVYFSFGPFLLLALFADEVFDIIGRGAFIFAYKLGSVALVSSVAAMQPFITLLYVIILGLFIPGVISEELDRKTMVLKAAAVIMIIAGVYLVS
jgi:drug/metabolite transporter (DMT)-like permease